MRKTAPWSGDGGHPGRGTPGASPCTPNARSSARSRAGRPGKEAHRPLDRHRRRRCRAAGDILTVVLVFAVGGKKNDEKKKVTTVSVPEVVGLNEPEAR